MLDDAPVTSSGLPFEKPALKATAIFVGEDFGKRLEKAIERAQGPKVLEPPPLDV
jgi:hypothetical protein